ncbi:hypothetical protein G4V62_14565 [Bacillaceae bacterium SIJ1]|uniref:hypothetical protein n=1 Tax=Litoribacterium kuwaitense TaxID=1398745 RepID=UPI0013ECF5DF|nr:hypothetical protein [Litoribacterium kuwaitense]NGP46115.1 hypothetical protein [Litoribacterium kuwaitense]
MKLRKGVLRKLVALTTVATFTLGAFGPAASAQENESAKILEDLSAQHLQELREYTEENNFDVVIHDFELTMDEGKLEDYNFDPLAIEAKLDNQLEEMKENFKNIEKEQSISPMAVDEYTASVWSGVPGIGHAYINQDFEADVSSGKIHDVNLLGRSYDTGIQVGSWKHNRSWADISSSDRYLDVRMKGTLHYGIKGTPLSGSLSATFLDKFRASGSRLVSR